jgi:hypothetical protein
VSVASGYVYREKKARAVEGMYVFVDYETRPSTKTTEKAGDYAKVLARKEATEKVDGQNANARKVPGFAPRRLEWL